MSKIQTVSVISFLSFSIIIGSLVFSRGFLLNRQVISDKAGPCLGDASHQDHYHRERDHQQLSSPSSGPPVELLGNLSEAASWCNRKPVFKKAILILVDALRFDFVGRMEFLSSKLGKGALNNMDEGYQQSEEEEVPQKLIKSSTRGHNNGNPSTKAINGDDIRSRGGKLAEEASCMFRFVADPPTTTMQRLKALMTGTMPTFIDASANFNSYEIEEDSLIYQLQAIGKKIAFLGDDTWLSLFPSSYFKSPFVETHPSFNAWDLDTVDRAVNHSLRNKIFAKKENEEEWDVLIAHLLGVDHCGHRYGPAHPEMKRKLREADEILEFVFNSMSRDTLLVVFGDHGMTHTGDHGGDSKDEVESAVVFLTKATKRVGSEWQSGFQCPSYTSGISQIDLVPTVATLLGTPIPFSSIGQLVPNFIRKNDLYTDAVAANAAQVDRYIRRFGMIGSASAGGANLEQDFRQLEQAFRSFQLSRTNQSARAKVNTLAHKYLTQVKFLAVSTWTQFNVPMIYTGVVITFLATAALFAYLVNMNTLSSSRMQYNYSVLSWLWPSLPLWSVCWTFVKQSPSPATSLLAIIVSTVAGLIMFLGLLAAALLKVMGESRGGSAVRRRRSARWMVSDIGALLVYLLTCLAMFSNSFVINEGSMLGCALMLVVFLSVVFSSAGGVAPPPRAKDFLSTSTGGREPLYSSQQQQQQHGSTKDDSVLHGILLCKNVKCSVACFIVLAVLVRTCSIFFRCREELVQCTEDYLLHKQLSSLPEDWVVHKYVRYSIALVSLAIFVVAFRTWMLYQKCLFSKRPAAIVAKFIPSLLVVLLGVFWALQGLPFISARVRPILNYFPWVFQACTFISLVLVWLKPVLTSHSRQPRHLSPHFQLTCNRCVRGMSKKTTATEGVATNNTSSTTTSTTSNNNLPVWSKSNVPSRQKCPPSNGMVKKINGISKSRESVISKAAYVPQRQLQPGGHRAGVLVDVEQQQYHFVDDDSVTGHYSSCILLMSTLVIVLMTQITSVGLTPAVAIILPYSIVSLVGIYTNKSPSVSSSSTSQFFQGDSWSAVVAWTLASQYFFYGTGHQAIFSAIPWDSAFLSTTDGNSFTESAGSWVTWLRPALAIIGNLHVSQIIFSLTLPLLSYWSPTSHFMCHHHCHRQRRKAYELCGKFLLLHGLKLLACMACAGWQRRHLMVWKIFAPKFIFEAISFIVTTFTVTFSLVFVTRIDSLYHRNRHK